MTLVCICWFHVKIHRIWKVFYKKKMGVTQKTTQKGWLDEFHHCTYFNTFLFCCLVIFQVILITIDDPILWYRLFLRLLAVYPCHIHMFLPFRMAKQPTFFLVVSPIAQAAHRLDPRDPEGPPEYRHKRCSCTESTGCSSPRKKWADWAVLVYPSIIIIPWNTGWLRTGFPVLGLLESPIHKR